MSAPRPSRIATSRRAMSPSNGGLSLATLLALATFLSVGPSAPEARAQEVRISGNQAFSGISEVGNPQGTGFGFRYFLSSGLGFGIDRDRYGSDKVVDRFICPAGTSTEDCSLEPVAFEFDLDFTTFLVFLELGRSESWAFRIGGGRSAGQIVGEGTGRETGRTLVPAQADNGSGAIAWSRGADGVLLVLELLRPIPIPGPLSWEVSASFRNHRVEMSGCGEGDFSPFCGTMVMTELQAGLVIGRAR